MTRAQIRMHDVLMVDQLEQINDFEANVNRLDFCEESGLALDLRARQEVLLSHIVARHLGSRICLSGRLRILLLVRGQQAFLLDFQAGLFLKDVLLEAVSLGLLDLAIDDSLWELSKRDDSRHARVLHLRQDQRLLPQVVEEAELGQFSVLLDHEDIEDVDCALLVNCVCLEPVDIVHVVQREVVLAKSVEIVVHVLVRVVNDLNVASDAATTVT